MRRPRFSSGAGRSIRSVFSGSLIGQGAVLASSPLLARLYSPADFGTLTVVTALSAILGAGVTMGWERAIPLARRESEARSLVALGVASTLAISVAVAAVGWFIRDDVANALSAPDFARVFWVVPLTAAMLGSQRIVAAILARRQSFGSLGRRNAALGLAQAGAGILLAPFGGGVGLLLASPIGRLAALAGLRRSRRDRASRGPTGSSRQKVRYPDLRDVAERYRRFPLFSTWSGLLNSSGLQVPFLILSMGYGSAGVGLAALSLRLVATPVGVLSDAIGSVFDGRASALIRDDRPLARSILRLVTRLLPAALVGLILVWCFSGTLVPAIFGSTWSAGASAARAIALASAAQLVVAPVSRVLSMLERQASQLVWDALRLVLTSASVLLAVLAGADIDSALGALAVTSTVLYAALLTMVLVATRHRDSALRVTPALSDRARITDELA